MTIRKVSARAAKRALGAMGDASQPIAAPVYGSGEGLVPMISAGPAPNGQIIVASPGAPPPNTIPQIPTPLASGVTPIATTTALLVYMGLGPILLLAAGGLGIYLLAKA